jgi:hypothetical protein
MLDANGVDSVEIDLECAAIRLLGAHPDARRTFDLLEEVRYRQAAFFGHLGPVPAQNLGVDEYLRPVLLLAGIHHQQRPVHVDLGSRQPDAWGRVHGFEHARDQLLQCSIKRRDRLGARP